MSLSGADPSEDTAAMGLKIAKYPSHYFFRLILYSVCNNRKDTRTSYGKYKLCSNLFNES